MGTCIHTWYITSDMESRALADPQAVLVSGVCVRRAHMCFQNWLSIIIGAGRALDMGAYTGADVLVVIICMVFMLRNGHQRSS